MKADPIMRWLHDARTKIEHVGDLDLESVAKVTVVASWLDGPYAEFQVLPHIGPEEIAAGFRETDLPDLVRKEGLLKVERRWVSQDLPDRELTEVCAYGYGVLATVMAEAHARLGVQMQTFGGEMHGGRHQREAQSGGPLPCMLLSKEARISHLHLASGNLIEMERVGVEIDERDAEFFKQRSEAMLVDPAIAFAHSPDDDPLDIAGQVSSVARRTLAHDGYHDPIAFFFDDENRFLGASGMHFEDQAEKYLAFRGLAARAEELGASTVVQVGEVWEARVEKKDLSPTMPRASERPDRTEALCVMAVTRDGRARTYATPFSRDSKGNPVLGETRVPNEGDHFNASMLPLQEMWSRRSAGDDPTPS